MMLEHVLQDTQANCSDRLTFKDLMRLFGTLDEDADGKTFIMVDNPHPFGGFRADGDDEGYADEN
jgi:hypothetical protein